MASYTLTDLVTKSQALLNDTGGTYYTLAILTPYIDLAVDELDSVLRNNGVPQTKFVSSVLTVTAGTIVLNQGSSPAIPANLVEPLLIFERAVGGAEQDFIQLIGPATIPNVNVGTSLVYWDLVMDSSNGLTIQFNPAGGASSNREIRIIYEGEVVPMSSGSDKSVFLGAENAIVYKTCTLVAGSRGNGTAVQGFEDQWIKARDRYVEEQVKLNQAVPGRRQPWLGGGRYLIARY
jgi:hypothetical protein